ncbi:MAG TPA: hypothetical protein PLD79_06925 [Halothiobacillus sp.]|nr:hypothetical protein [Halothiobacillus sp.]
MRYIADFPKSGVLFRDISPLLNNPFREVIPLVSDQLTHKEWQGIDTIADITTLINLTALNQFSWAELTVHSPLSY